MDAFQRVKEPPNRQNKERIVGTGVRLQCPTLSLVRTPASMVDRGTHCTFALSATGSANTRGLDGPFEGIYKAEVRYTFI